MYRLLIVEDDKGIAEAIKVQAEMWDLEVYCITNFRNVMAEFSAFNPHIILLDIVLPFFNGYHWCSEIRKVSKVPIIFISSASDNMNMVMAMNMGADDFIAKPFDQSVLMAKLQAMLRRTLCYSYLNDKTDDFLEANDFSRDEIKLGLENVADSFGLSNIAKMFLTDF